MKKIIFLFAACLFTFVSQQIYGQDDDYLRSESNNEIPKTTMVSSQSQNPITQEEDIESNGFTKNWFIGIKGGATFFFSPLKSNPWSWGAAASLGKQLNSKTALRLDYLYGNLKSDGEYMFKLKDGSQCEGQLYANVDFMEIALVLKINMNDLFYTKSPKYLREFYLFGGGAYTLFRAKITDDNGSFVSGAGYSEEGEQEDMECVMAVPLGLGLTYKLGKRDIVNLNAEFGYRYRFVHSDKLNGGLANRASHYAFSSLGLIFNLGKHTNSTQKITSDRIKEELDKEMTAKLYAEVDKKIIAEMKPVNEQLTRQTLSIADNQEQIRILQGEMEVSTNTLQEQMAALTANSRSGFGIDMTSVYFAFNSTYVTPKMEGEIALIAKVLKKNKDLKCTIIGNSSNVGGAEYNLQISQKRAQAVLNMLVEEFRISADRLSLENKGLEDPLAENLKRLNRRVDIIIE